MLCWCVRASMSAVPVSSLGWIVKDEGHNPAPVVHEKSSHAVALHKEVGGAGARLHPRPCKDGQTHAPERLLKKGRLLKE